jgi:hypothetical protein
MTKRVLFGLVVAAAAFAATPAQATSTLPVELVVEHNYVGVRSGVPGQPLVNGGVHTDTGVVCVGFSLQVPVCTPAILGPIS